MHVGVGVIQEIKTARPAGANLLPSPPHGLSAEKAKADGTLPDLLGGIVLLSSLGLNTAWIGMVHEGFLRVC
jgi:hypothetical protein